MLIIFSGLPGVGKTTIARELARQIGAVHVRADTIEQAMRDSGRCLEPLNDAGYRVAYAVAEENLRIGHKVVADSVNPFSLTRNAWRAVANRAGTSAVEIEIKCSDVAEHRRRAESRVSDIPGLYLPAWEEMASREYHPWDRDHIVIDTASHTVQESVRLVADRL
jgi:predicted kinase